MTLRTALSAGRPAAALILCVIGCASDEARMDRAIKEYREASSKIEIGTSKQDVLSRLDPSQGGLPPISRRAPLSYRDAKGTVVEIHYFRTARRPDGINTDDEFTPYVFRDERLVGVGWQAAHAASPEADAMKSCMDRAVSIASSMAKAPPGAAAALCRFEWETALCQHELTLTVLGKTQQEAPGNTYLVGALQATLASAESKMLLAQRRYETCRSQ